MAGHFVGAGVKTIEQSVMSFLSFPSAAGEISHSCGRSVERESRKKLVRRLVSSLSLVLFLLLITPSLSFASCCRDNDGDGYSDHKTCRSGTDCDDRDWFIRPGTLGCNNCKDVDDDGYFAHDLRDCSLGDDLDDADPEANPGKDTGGGNGGGGGCSSVVWYKDYDDDKYSADGIPPLTQCDQPPGYKPASDLVQISGDCKDDPSVEPLAYKINPGAEEVCDDWKIDNNCDGTIDEGCCEGWIDASLTEVRPQNTGYSTKMYVIIGLNKPAPPKGCNVSLVVEPEKKSGGHEHDDDKRPKGALSKDPLLEGTFLKDTLLFREGETDTKYLLYTSSAISGIEKIKAEFKESKKEPNKSAEKTITVKVPELQEFPSSGAHWVVKRFNIANHPDSTHGTSTAVAMLKKVAEYYFKRTKRQLSVNDLSLPMGGLYDYNATWASPHSTHKTGTDADINRTDGGKVFTDCWQDTDLKKAVAKTAEDKAFPRLICEDKNHKPVPLDDPNGLYKHIDFD